MRALKCLVLILGAIVGLNAVPAAASAATSLSIGSVSVVEGNSGGTPAKFTISRSGDLSISSTVSWATAGVSAVSPSDYGSASGKVGFAVGETTKAVSVTVASDTVAELDERFTVDLSVPTGATIANGRGVGTILNDDTGLSIDDVSLTEGNSGTQLATFTITRNGPTSGASSVGWATANGTAIAGSDYTAASGTASLVAGETTKTVSVAVVGDTVGESTETFKIKLSSPSGAGLIDGTGVATIVNDDTGLSISSPSIIEGNSGTQLLTFTITRTGPTTGTSSVNWATADGSAVAGSDFVAASGTVTFAIGEVSKTVSVTINGDTVVESKETFRVVLSQPVGATIVNGTGTGTIDNDD